MGAILALFGSNKFLSFMPMPEIPEQAGKLMMAFAESGYIFPAIGIVEVVVGLMLLFNFYKPLALVMFVPITINILLFHFFLDLHGIGAGALVAILHITLIVLNKDKLIGLLNND